MNEGKGAVGGNTRTQTHSWSGFRGVPDPDTSMSTFVHRLPGLTSTNHRGNSSATNGKYAATATGASSSLADFGYRKWKSPHVENFSGAVAAGWGAYVSTAGGTATIVSITHESSVQCCRQDLVAAPAPPRRGVCRCGAAVARTPGETPRTSAVQTEAFSAQTAVSATRHQTPHSQQSVTPQQGGTQRQTSNHELGVR